MIIHNILSLPLLLTERYKYQE